LGSKMSKEQLRLEEVIDKQMESAYFVGKHCVGFPPEVKARIRRKILEADKARNTKTASIVRRSFELEYPIRYKEEADFVGELIDRGWIPPEEAKMNCIRKAECEDAEAECQQRVEGMDVEKLKEEMACLICGGLFYDGLFCGGHPAEPKGPAFSPVCKQSLKEAAKAFLLIERYCEDNKIKQVVGGELPSVNEDDPFIRLDEQVKMIKWHEQSLKPVRLVE